jgi:nitrogen PTS system EIIA component
MQTYGVFFIKVPKNIQLCSIKYSGLLYTLDVSQSCVKCCVKQLHGPGFEKTKMPENIALNLALPRLKASSTQNMLSILAQDIAAATTTPLSVISDGLTIAARAQAGIGRGVALWHLSAPAIKRTHTTLATLETALEIETTDHTPVDIVCILMTPPSAKPLHLSALAQIARLLKNQELCDKMRETSDADVMKSLFANPEGWLRAA